MASTTKLSDLTPHEAAALVGVGVQSIRRWCDWHTMHLSPGANPGPGMPRRLDRRDVEVLIRVRELRYQGLQTEAINEKMSSMAFPEIDSPTDKEAEIVDSIAASPVTPQQVLAPYEGIDAIQALEKRIEVRLDAMERRRWNEVALFAFGFCAASLMFLLLILLANLYR